MQETVALRKSTAADRDALLPCEQGIIRAERPFSPMRKEDPVQYCDLEKMLTDLQTDVIVAEGNSHRWLWVFPHRSIKAL